MRSLKTRVGALENETAPFTPIHFHVIGQPDGISRKQAIAAYEAENGQVGEQDGIIFLVGLESK
jgi:hypothetical protein